MSEAPKVLTFPQRKALGGLLHRTTTQTTAKQLGVRSDVLWRLEEWGYVARSFSDLWYIRPAGREAYEATLTALYGERVES